MSFPATAVANEFLTIAMAAGKELTPMKIQKLVYFAHGWFLALTGEPLISEQIEAWQYGPVIPSLYQEFKEYGNLPVVTPAFETRYDGWKPSFVVSRLGGSGDAVDKARQVINKVWQLYGEYTSVRLSNATHAAGSPWSQVYAEGRKHTVIPEETIKTYFRELANAARR
jgi:uncharacterized phage-associated protein